MKSEGCQEKNVKFEVLDEFRLKVANLQELDEKRGPGNRGSESGVLGHFQGGACMLIYSIPFVLNLSVLIAFRS